MLRYVRISICGSQNSDTKQSLFVCWMFYSSAATCLCDVLISVNTPLYANQRSHVNEPGWRWGCVGLHINRT